MQQLVCLEKGQALMAMHNDQGYAKQYRDMIKGKGDDRWNTRIY